MEKICFGKVIISEEEKAFRVQTSFYLGRSGHPGNDGKFGCFEAALHSLDIYPEAFYDNYFFLPKQSEINIGVFKQQLKRWKFEVVEGGLLLEIKSLPVEKKVETKKFIIPKKNELPTILALDLKNYVREGTLFKGNEQIIDSVNWFRLTVNSTLNKLMDSLYSTSFSSACIISMKKFLSQYEIENKLLPQLPENFKGKSILDFLSTRRTSEILQIYSKLSIQDKQKNVGDTLSNGFIFVDANRIYDLIYKFGTQNKKAYFIYRNLYVLKPYRWDYVVFINIAYLNSLDNNAMVTFSLI